MRRYSRMKGPDVFQEREEWVHFRDGGGGVDLGDGALVSMHFTDGWLQGMLTPGPRVIAFAVSAHSRASRASAHTPALPRVAPLWSSSWWFFSSFTDRWAWLPSAPSASSPELLPVTGGIPGGWRPDGWGGSWTGGPCVAWERCCAWSCCCCNEVGGEHGQGPGPLAPPGGSRATRTAPHPTPKLHPQLRPHAVMLEEVC